MATASASNSVQVRGPRGNPLLGNAVALSRGTLRYLERCAREYGDLVPLRFLWKPILFVNGPELIEEVLVANRHRLVKDIAQRSDHALIGNGLFLSEGATWRQQRHLMQPAFHRERIAAYGATMVEYTARTTALWHDGETRDIYDEMSRLTMSVVARTLFSADLWDEADEVAGGLDEALAALAARVRSPQVLLPRGLPTPTHRRLWRARRRIDAIVYRIIAVRRASGEDGDDLLGMLLAARDETGAPLPNRQVRDEVMTILVGGYETAADLLTCAWALLTRHPEAEATLHAELQQVLAGRAPTVADLPQLRYAGWIISEALRLYPPAPALGREVTEAFTLGDYHVAKGTDLLVSQWVMHRDPRYFSAPDQFLPERWADDLAGQLPRFAYFPFGGGPRICIGNTFAIMEMTLILATIAQQYRLELLDERPIVMETLPTLRPRGGLRMRCRRL
jgi:cytochrome P450